jgi:hypothetical protein
MRVCLKPLGRCRARAGGWGGFVVHIVEKEPGEQGVLGHLVGVAVAEIAHPLMAGIEQSFINS